MITTKNRSVLSALLLLAIGLMPSCKHDAGVLDKCLGKNITIDTTADQLVLMPLDTTTKPWTGGEIYIDSSKSYIKADNRKPPYTVSFDGGKSWQKLPIDSSNCLLKSYQIVVKDADGCVSPTYNIATF